MLQLSFSGETSHSASANQLLKDAYPQTLRHAALLALALMVLVFAVWPPVIIQPYRLPVEETRITEIDVISTAPVRLPRTVRGLSEAGPAPVFEPALLNEMPPLMSMTDLGLASEGPAIAMPRPPEPIFVDFHTQPELRNRAVPAYPEMARELGLNGMVVIDALVGTEGRVLQAIVVSGVHPILDKSALRAALDSRFEPARQRQQPVPVWVRLPYDFKMF